MRSNRLFWRLNAVLALFLLALAPPIGSLRGATAASEGNTGESLSVAGAAAQDGARPVIRPAVHADSSRPLAEIEPALPEPEEGPSNPKPRKWLPNREGSSGPTGDSVLQDFFGSPDIPAPLVNFEGASNLNGVLPPDTDGDIGPEHYVQMVNLSFAVYNRTGGLLYGPANTNTLWAGFGGACQTTNHGDPIVLYDELADRWLMSQFALPNFPNGPFYECIAISQTGDPLGAWHRYAFLISDTKLDDYPKFGVWPDGYYMSVNQFTCNLVTCNWAGQATVAFERDKMLAGDPTAASVIFDLFGVNPNLGGMLPSDLDGPPPPAGAPNLFSEVDDASFGFPNDQVQLWEFAVDWEDPGSSTFTHLVDLPTAAFDPNMCNFSRNCIPQPGGTNVDAISDRLMYRLQYRNFGTHQTLVTNHTVDANGANRAGVRWYELRNTGTGWSIFQQGTYSPDANHRWMGSIAMNSVGDIALGYSISSASVFPSIRYTGRLNGDAAGQMTQGEGTLIAGSGVQTHSSGRWGDYSMMSVDPSDDCTFWYTQEYYEETGSATWQTRVGSFKIRDCEGVSPEANLSIIKEANLDPVSPGQDLTYTLTVENAGPDAAAGVTVDDTLPSGVTLVTVTPSQGGCASLPCSLGVIASGGTATVTVVVHVEGSALDPLENTAEVSSSTDDPVPTNNSDTIETEVIHHVYLPLVMKSPPGP